MASGITMFLNAEVHAQTDSLKTKQDSVQVEIKSEQVTLDSISRTRTEKSDEFYKKSENLFSRNKALKKVFGSIIRSDAVVLDSCDFPAKVANKKQNILALTELYNHPENIEETYKVLNGKIVGNIYFRRFDPFGYDMDDSLLSQQTNGSMFFNNLHVTTKEWVLRNALNMQSGEVINSAKLAFEENYIRDLNYIKDCRILPVFREYCINDSMCFYLDTIDFMIVTQDVWTIVPSITINRVPKFDDTFNGQIDKAYYETKYRVRMQDYNLAGMGHQLAGTFYHNGKQSPPDAYRASYYIPVFTKAQATLYVQYDIFPEQKSFSAQFNRNFITPVTRYGYGLTTNVSNIYGDVINDTLQRYVQPVKISIQDAWAGRAFKLNFLPADVSAKTRAILSMRYFTLANITPLNTVTDSTLQYRNNFAVLGSIGITTRSYFRDVLVYGFGRTENIPNGISVAFSGGYNKVSGNNLVLTQFTAAGGRYLKGNGYFYFSSSILGYTGNNRLTDMSFQLTANHFSHLYKLGQCRLRLFYATQFIFFENDIYKRYTNLDGSNGIRGKGSEYWTGTKKLRFSFESVLFTPLQVAGFNFNFYSFLDAGIINNRYTSLFKNSLYEGLGLGLRIRNDHFVMNVIQVQFGLYPNMPMDVSSTKFSAGSVSQYKLSDFTINKPALFDY
ncbi:MAG: hypothetical protein ABI723_02550 [Bacteroidia bacterium]